MTNKLIPISILLTVSLLISSSHSQTCSSQIFTNNKLYNHCSDLSQLNSQIHWTYDSSNSTLSLAFVAPPAKPDGWISWAINPTADGMVGAQSLVAFKDTNGAMVVKTYDLKSYISIVPGKLSIDVTDMGADYVGGLMRIYATVKVGESMGTTLNQVWQVGAVVNGGFPGKHDFGAANLNAKGTLDLLKGQSGVATTKGGSGSRSRNKNIHGLLNVVSWGIMFPVGIIIARYLKTFPSADPAWFYLHVLCQCSAYIIGVAGWGTGMKLGSQSKGVQYSGHRNIGIALFALATVQVFALFLRPKKEHKLRVYWNVYHRSMGYAVIILGIINVFKGLDILQPAQKWKTAYTGLIIALGALAVLLEAITWIIVLRRRSDKSTKPYDGYNNGQARQLPLNPLYSLTSAA